MKTKKIQAEMGLTKKLTTAKLSHLLRINEKQESLLVVNGDADLISSQTSDWYTCATA